MCITKCYLGSLMHLIGYFSEEGSKSVNSGKCLQSFMDLCVFYRLFTVVYFETLGSGMFHVNVIGSLWNLMYYIDYSTLFFEKGSRGVTHGYFWESFMHFDLFYQLFTIVCFGKELGCHLWKFFCTILITFWWIMSAILPYIFNW